MRRRTALFINANPSLAFVYRLKGFRLGHVNRSFSEPVVWPDGKAVNAAIVFARLGGRPLAVLPAGGASGAYLRRTLSRLVPFRIVPTGKELRRTYTFVVGRDGRMVETHLLEPGPKLSRAHVDRLLKVSTMAARRTEFSVISGSLPTGTPSGFYRTLIDGIRASSSSIILVDTSGPALAPAVRAGPDVLKVNRAEFLALMPDHRLPSRRNLLAEMQRVGERHRIACIVMTQGADDVLVWSRAAGFYRARPPKVEVANTLGAGDSFVAGWILAGNGGIEECLRMAVATATASVTVATPPEIDPKLVRRLYARTEVARLVR